MFNNVALDVVIGLVFVYLLYSLLGTIVQEMIAANFGLRAKMLRRAIRRMLDDDKRSHRRKQRELTAQINNLSELLKNKNFSDDQKKTLQTTIDQIHKDKDKLRAGYIEEKSKMTGQKLSDVFYSHPLIKYLAADNWLLKKAPSYIDPETFSKVVIDLLRGQNITAGASDRQPIQTSLDNKKIAWEKDVPIEPETLLYLRSIWADAQGDVTKFKTNLEQWFNEMMDRAAGWYKKKTQIILLIVGLVIAGAFNVDTIKIATQLSRDPKLREQMIAQATNYLKAHPDIDQEIAETTKSFNAQTNPKTQDSLKKVLANQKQSKAFSNDLYTNATNLVGNDIGSLKQTLAIGWNEISRREFGWLTIAGWVLTAFAISMGAPFWFDLLNKLMKLRSSVAPKEDANTKSDPVVTPVKRVG